MRYALALIVGLYALPCAAQFPQGPLGPVPTGPLQLPEVDGLGDTGVATTNATWFASGMQHVFLWTGANPEPYGSFTIVLDPILYPLRASGLHPHPLCTATAAWTGDDYKGAFENPRWPMVSIQQDAYDVKANTVTFLWQAAAWLQPFSAYSIILNCGSKAELAGQ